MMFTQGQNHLMSRDLELILVVKWPMTILVEGHRSRFIQEGWAMVCSYLKRMEGKRKSVKGK